MLYNFDIDNKAKAAAYIRSATDEAEALRRQLETIRRFAEERGYKIVKMYKDVGKSGLNTADRPSLVELVRDIESERVEFSTVILYDVARWGRFSDADKSAYYESICKCRGIDVQYCLNPTTDAETPISGIIKKIGAVINAI